MGVPLSTRAENYLGRCQTGAYAKLKEDLMRTFRLAILAAYSTAFAADHGLSVGASMPNFEARDQNGQTHSLKDILGPNGAALVFYRSADW